MIGFSKKLIDYRILIDRVKLDEIYSNTDNDNLFTTDLEEYIGKDYYVVTADREIANNDWYYWIGYLILDESNNIIDGICFN